MKNKFFFILGILVVCFVLLVGCNAQPYYKVDLSGLDRMTDEQLRKEVDFYINKVSGDNGLGETYYQRLFYLDMIEVYQNQMLQNTLTVKEDK